MTLGDLIKRYITSKKALYYRKKYFEIMRKKEKHPCDETEYWILRDKAQYYFTKFCQNTCMNFAD